MDESPQWRRRDADEAASPPSHRDRWFLVLGSLAMLGLLAAGGWWMLSRRPPPKPPPVKAAAEPAPAPPPPAELTFQAPIQGRNIIAISAPLEGALEALEVQTGSAVFEEQLLARVKNLGLESMREASRLDMESAQDRVNNLDSALIAARLEASRTAAEADRTRDDFNRVDRLAQRQRMLFNEGATPRLTYEKAEKDAATARSMADAASEMARQAVSRVESAQHDLDTAKKVLEDKVADLEGSTEAMQAAEIRSPVDGVLVAIRAEQGAEVTPDMPDLFQIAVNPAELMAIVEPDPEQQTQLDAALARGEVTASIQILELGSAIDGKLTRSEDGKYRVEFNSNEVNVKPGLNALVRIKLR
ncbi:MAG: hypothetical protein R2729_19680 [Bryobacteraceae bacterium]